MTIAVASAHPDVIDLRPHHMTLDMGKQHNVTQDKQTWESYYTPKVYEVVNRRFGDEIQHYYPLRDGSEKP